MKNEVLLPALLLAACTDVPRPRSPAPERQAPAQETAPRPAEPAAPATNVAAATGDMGLALYRLLAAEPGNVFLSPVSIAGAFGPVVAGAEGETRQAILGALRLPRGEGLHGELGGLLRGLERSREGATVSIANALWVKRDFALRPQFAANARANYDALVEPLDFERAPAAAAQRINNWVGEETRGRIKELIKASSLDADTRLVVTNAVYFLGDWALPFNPSATSEQPFYGPGGAVRQVPLMAMKRRFRYFETESFQAIDLPYKDERLSMSVFLPRQRDGLRAFERGIDAAKLREWLARLDSAAPQEVRLFLPKLKVERSYNLVPALGQLGMGIAFDPRRANFRSIAEADLFISQVVHKSFVRIDEKGTEAAAATGIEIEATGAPIRPPPVFRADHSFFFLLRDKESGAVLFLGRIEAPERP